MPAAKLHLETRREETLRRLRAIDARQKPTAEGEEAAAEALEAMTDLSRGRQADRDRTETVWESNPSTPSINPNEET